MGIAFLLEWLWLDGVVGFKTNCQHMGPGLTGGGLRGGVLLRILARIYDSFGENHEKFRSVRSTSAMRIEPGTSHLPVLSSHWWGQQRTVLTSMPYPVPSVQQSAPLTTTPLGRFSFQEVSFGQNEFSNAKLRILFQMKKIYFSNNNVNTFFFLAQIYKKNVRSMIIDCENICIEMWRYIYPFQRFGGRVRYNYFGLRSV